MSKRLAIWSLPALWMAAVFVFTLHLSPAREHGPQTLLLCGASVFANFFVLRYHYTHPPHPKFVMLPARRRCLRVHIVSGSVELLAGLAAYALGSPALALVMAAAALLGHVPSSAFQVPIVFGIKAVMSSAYAFVIALHAYCAFHLLLEPSSTDWLINTFLVLNIYVWVRACYYALTRLQLFADSRYTVATLVAGLLILPAVLGPMGNLCVLSFVLLYALLGRSLGAPDAAGRRDFVRERSRDGFVDPTSKSLWARRQLERAGVAPPIGLEASRRHAAAVFSRLDSDGDGLLDEDELADLLSELGASQGYLRSFLLRYGASGRFFVEAFFRHVWREQSVQARLRARPDPRRRYSDREQAQLVFDQLDVDGTGALDRFELRVLLVEWGLPEEEVERYISLFDADRDDLLSFDEFRLSFAPIWRYCFHLLRSGEAGVS